MVCPTALSHFNLSVPFICHRGLSFLVKPGRGLFTVLGFADIFWLFAYSLMLV